jgi:hypothetical protein
MPRTIGNYQSSTVAGETERTDGDWEGWTQFYLACVEESAQDGVAVAQRIFALIGKDRGRLMSDAGATWRRSICSTCCRQIRSSRCRMRRNC